MHRWHMGRFVRGAGSILAMSFVFVVILLATTLVLSGIFAYWRGISLVSPESLSIALTCGLIIWLFVAIIHLNKDSLQLPITTPEGFLDKACEVLKEMGYEVVFKTANHVSTSPGFYSFLFGSGILIRLDGHQAKIIGPKILAELVRKRLRLQNHIGKVQQTLLDQRRRPPGQLLHRLQIRLKVTPQQLGAVQRHVIEPLAEEGNVICMLTIQAQSDKGIRDIAPDSPIRVWLDQQGLHADIHQPLHASACDDTLTGREVAELLQEAPKKVSST